MTSFMLHGLSADSAIEPAANRQRGDLAEKPAAVHNKQNRFRGFLAKSEPADVVVAFGRASRLLGKHLVGGTNALVEFP